VRTLRYQAIADDLRTRLTAGEPAPGGLLPSEAELCSRYDVSRVTVRRALDLLREEGLIESRQGFGWFVAVDPLRQQLARLGTIEGQLAASGRKPERRVLDFAFVAAPRRVRDVLSAAQVLQVDRLNLADGQPFARVTVWCPEELGATLSRAQVEKAPFYELLDLEIGRATQTIGAAAANATDAELLHVPLGSPVLRCERVTRDIDDRPILLSEHVFAGHRTELVVELPRFEPSMGPSGLRLVE